ncbi:hypothetical protein [Cytobacillus sp. FSL R7-0680]|uniref:hypothetical protein n=1 Tax=Cytobacillus sp. FSL R7-0680 TaxID=2921689 RepID=UPI0030F694B2
MMIKKYQAYIPYNHLLLFIATTGILSWLASGIPDADTKFSKGRLYGFSKG